MSLQRIRSIRSLTVYFPLSSAQQKSSVIFFCLFLFRKGISHPPKKFFKFSPSAEIQISSIRNPPGKDSHGEFPATPMDVFGENHGPRNYSFHPNRGWRLNHLLSLRFFFCYMDVSENSGTPISSILIGISIINRPFWGTPIFGNIHMQQQCVAH